MSAIGPTSDVAMPPVAVLRKVSFWCGWRSRGGATEMRHQRTLAPLQFPDVLETPKSPFSPLRRLRSAAIDLDGGADVLAAKALGAEIVEDATCGL